MRTRSPMWTDAWSLLLGAAAAVPVLLTVSRLPSLPLQVAAAGLLAGAVVVAAVRLRQGIGALAFSVLVLAVFLLPMNNVRPAAWATLSDVWLVVAFGLALLQPLAGRRPPVPRLVGYGLLVLAVGGALGSLASPEPLLGLVNFIRLLVTVLAALGGVLLWQPGLRQVRVLAAAWLLGNAVSVLVAFTVRPAVVGARPAGLTTHPNALGLLCVLSAAIAIFLYSAGGRVEKALAVVSFGLCVLGTGVSGSRAALIAFVAVVVAWGVMRRSWLLLGASLALGAVVAVVGAKVLASMGSSTAVARLLAPDESVGSSDEDRLGRLHESLDQFASRPVLGSGFADATDAHNILLQILVAGGLVALVGFVLVCWPTLRGLRRSDIGPWRWLSLIPVAYLSYGMFANNLWDRYIWLPLALGLYAGLLPPAADRPPAPPRPPPAPARPVPARSAATG